MINKKLSNKTDPMSVFFILSHRIFFHKKNLVAMLSV